MQTTLKQIKTILEKRLGLRITAKWLHGERYIIGIKGYTPTNVRVIDVEIASPVVGSQGWHVNYEKNKDFSEVIDVILRKLR